MLLISNFFVSMASRVNFNTLLEIKKLGPQFWEKIEKLRAREVFANFGRLIEQGQKEGYVVNAPKELILQIYIAAIQAVINPDFIVKNAFTTRQAGEMTIEIIFNGVLTEEGKVLYEKLKAEKI